MEVKQGFIGICKMAIFLITLLACLKLSAQDEKYKKIEEAKKAFLEERLHLSSELSKKFFPLYQEYTLEKRTIIRTYKEIKKIIKDSTTTAEVAKNNLYKLLQLKQQELELEKKYVEKYMVFLPPAKVAEILISEKDFLKILYKKISTSEGSSSTLPNR